MKIMPKIILILILLTGSLLPAEARTWTAKNGKTAEGKFVSQQAGKIVLRLASGKTIRVPIKGLCEKDQTYLATLIPPALKGEITVKKTKKVLIKTDYYQLIEEEIAPEIKIRKLTPTPYTAPLNLYVAIFAKDTLTGNFVLISKQKTDIQFDPSRKYKPTLTPAKIYRISMNAVLNKTPDQDYTKGAKFNSVVAWIETSGGTVSFLQSKPYGKQYKKFIQEISKLPAKTTVDKNFSPVPKKQASICFSKAEITPPPPAKKTKKK